MIKNPIYALLAFLFLGGCQPKNNNGMQGNQGTSTFEIEKMNFQPALTIGQPGTHTIHFSEPDSESLFIDQVYFFDGKDQPRLRLQLLHGSQEGHYKASGDIENFQELLRTLNLVPLGNSNDEFGFAKTEMFAIRLAQLSYLCHGVCLKKDVSEQNAKHLVHTFSLLQELAASCDMESLSSSYDTYLKSYIDTTNYPSDKIDLDIEVFIKDFLENGREVYKNYGISAFANKLLTNMSDNCRINPNPIHNIINMVYYMSAHSKR